MRSQVKKLGYSQGILALAHNGAKVFEDIFVGVLGFIPNGFEQIYDGFLKRIPIIGQFFSRRWVEQVIKLCTGVTIGKGIATDAGRFIFWPIGFCLGALIGMAWVTHRDIGSYRNQVRYFLYKLSGYTVSGAFIGAIAAYFIFELIAYRWGLCVKLFTGIGAVGGAIVGVIAYVMYHFALNAIMTNQTERFAQHVAVAKKLGSTLKEIAKQSAKGRILVYAQDIIQQMNGPEAQLHLNEFFDKEFDDIAHPLTKKIERHFNVLTGRACHGDKQALSHLQALTHRKKELNALLDRLFNARTIAKIKDEVDTCYDQWHYRFLKAN